MPIGYAPAWSPSGLRIAFVTKHDLWVADADGTHRALLVPDGDQPVWSPDGRRIARGFQPSWKPPARALELLPDFDERAPTGLEIAGAPGFWELGFTSMVDNVGRGPSVIVGVRSPGHPRMNATQRVELSN